MDHSTALQIAQLTLAARRRSLTRALQREDIASAVDEVLALPTFANVSREALIGELEERFNVWQDDAQILHGTDSHEAWLPKKRAEIAWPLWQRYKLFSGKSLPFDSLENLDKVTDQILGELEDPERPAAWDRRGLVMGHVQSGKTASYVGLICKAADVGYKVIVVLAGLHNNLRSQTQIRLDQGFLGYRSVPPAPGGVTFEKTGVGEIDPRPRVDSVTNRSEVGDFNRTVAQNFGIHPGGNPLLFVVKKNVSVLRNLLAWIGSSADATDPTTGRRFHRDVPLLVIDDEADQASVDTKAGSVDEDGNPDDEHSPTRINELIRRLLMAFDKSAYVGYTATPFANIFIHESARTRELGEDLFPRSFIINLSAPSNYSGPARIFGIKDAADVGLEESSPLPIVRTVEDHAATDKTDEELGWMPPKLVARTEHVPEFNAARRIPDSLRTAMLSFLISTAVRSIRETGPLFNSMLIHVVRFTAVQERVMQQVAQELTAIKNRLIHGDGDRRPTIWDELENLWLNDYVPTSLQCGATLPAWKDVCSAVSKTIQNIEVRTINGSAGDALDYEEHRNTGLTVIAIGGDKLSRGLTLEGLTVSYFLRASKMYDTLMQMGRWFGYREKYVDVCRLYTTDELKKWFAHIAAATEELRAEFDYMVSIRGNPREFGLKVQSHPALLITAAVKMRSGTTMKLSFSGDVSETIIFDLADGVPRANLRATLKLLSAPSRRIDAEGSRRGGYLLSGFKADAILEFLGEYASHADALRANTKLLARYIRKQVEKGELADWSVFLASAESGDSWHVPVAGIGEVGMIKRSRDPEYPEASDPHRAGKRYTIKRLVNPTDEAVDLDDPQRVAALNAMVEAWKASQRKNKAASAPTEPAGRAARIVRAKTHGLLLIYPLNPDEAGHGGTDPIIGVALSFPASQTAETVEYKVNNVFTTAGDYESL
jgi:hypothetical protein